MFLVTKYHLITFNFFDNGSLIGAKSLRRRDYLDKTSAHNVNGSTAVINCSWSIFAPASTVSFLFNLNNSANSWCAVNIRQVSTEKYEENFIFPRKNILLRKNSVKKISIWFIFSSVCVFQIFYLFSFWKLFSDRPFLEFVCKPNIGWIGSSRLLNKFRQLSQPAERSA